VKTPEIGAYHALRAVEAIAPDDAWAVGRMQQNGQWFTLVEHWDGREWTVVPSGTQSGGILNSIAAASPDDIWAVGTASVPNTVVTLQWDGSTWSRFENGLPAITLDGVTAVAPDDVWAVGTGPDVAPLTAHWDGRSGSAVPSVAGFTLHSVASLASDDRRAVGETNGEALALHYTDPGARNQSSARASNGGP
jgi:hypothetical protein